MFEVMSFFSFSVFNCLSEAWSSYSDVQQKYYIKGECSNPGWKIKKEGNGTWKGGGENPQMAKSS